MIEAVLCQNLEKRFDRFSLCLPDFHVQKGTVHGLIGANGCGKTTTLKLLLGLLSPNNGTVSVLGSERVGSDVTIRQDIGFIIEDAALPSMLNPLEIGKVMSGIYKRWDTERYTSLLKDFHLDAKKPYRKCSRGMKIKMQLAIALSHNASLLILDEPTSALDPVAREEILDFLGNFSQDEEHTILISSHITSDLEKLCDYITFLENGRIKISEEKDSLLDSYRLIRIPLSNLEDIDPNTIIGMKKNAFAVDLLMKTEDVPSFADPSKVNLETLIIMMTKKGE